MDVTVLRSGIPDTLPGRSVNVCERGIAAVLSGELTPGEPVGLEVRLPLIATPLRTRALVRHYDRLRCGMEFVGLSSEQQAAIRDWAELSKAPAESDTGRSAEDASEDIEDKEDGGFHRDVSGPDNSEPPPPSRPRRKRRRAPWTLLLITAAVLASVLWWRWNRGWEELEAGLASHPVANGENRARVPAEVMEKLLLHRVDPDYPAAARPARLQGVIVLDVVVGPDGSVVQMRPLNGPEVLSRAAMEALRWWKFQPYRVNGQAVEVETTVAVEFKSPEIGNK
jgi:TonB family protein